MRDKRRRVWSFRWIMGAFALIAVTGWFPSIAVSDQTTAPGPADPMSLYGSEIRFDVLRDGDPVGYHLVNFRKTENGLQVESRSSIEVKLLFLTAYRFRYRSIETWHGGTLSSLSASTNDNGKFSHVEAVRDGATLKVRSGEDDWQAPNLALPTTHWNMAQTNAPAVLNTLTGRLNRVSVTDAGLETVALAEGTRQARRFTYSGDLKVESWYDSAGRWVKLRFLAEDGSTIEYVCRRCDGPTNVTDAE